jgi:hypothetical protein
MRSLLFAFAISLGAAAVPAIAHAQDTEGSSTVPEAMPTPYPGATPVTHPPPPEGEIGNMASGEIVPLYVLDYLQVEYERVLIPGVGGVAFRGRADYLNLGLFDLSDFGMGVHADAYLGDFLHLDKWSNPATPSGFFLQPGFDAQYWRGTFKGTAGYRSEISGTDVEPNLYGGYRLVVHHLFVGPRVGLGYAIGGARYVDDAGDRVYVSRTRGARVHFDLMLGLAW